MKFLNLGFQLAASLIAVLFSFVSISLQAQDGAIDPSFNPTDVGFGRGDGANSSVFAIAVQSDGKILIGGQFSTYNGTPRKSIARLNADGLLDSSFNPGTGTGFVVINTIALQNDGKILIGGDFSSFNGTSRNGIARLNADGSLDTGFDPGTGANHYVHMITVQSDGKILLGGQFTAYNGAQRNRIARLNSDGSLDPGFDPGTGADATVFAIILQSDGKILLGGLFTAYNDTNAPRITRLNVDGSRDPGFNPGTGANMNVDAVTLQDDGKILIGGSFTSYNGTPRNHISRLNANGSLDPGFNPGTGANNRVMAIRLKSDGKIFAGGYFTLYNNTPVNRFVSLNADGSLDAGFDHGTGTNEAIIDIVLQSDEKVLIAGLFFSYQGTPIRRIGRLNADGSPDPLFNPGSGASNVIRAIALQNNGKILIGGDFTAYNGTLRSYIARLNADGLLDTGFNSPAEANNIIDAITLQNDGKILIGGGFSNTNALSCFARLNTDGSPDTGFITTGGEKKEINAIVVQSDGKILVGGRVFTNNENVLDRLNADGSKDISFQKIVGPSNIINSIALQNDGKIIIVGEASINRIARINADGSLDLDFKPGSAANNTIMSVALQNDGKILIGGEFTSYNSTPRNRIARLNSDGSLDMSFNPGAGANNLVYTILPQSDGKILIGGEFTSYNGTPRNRIVRLNTDGSLDLSFNPGSGANSGVTAVALQSDGNILAGGFFTSYNNTGRNRLTRILSSPQAALPVNFTGIGAIAKNGGAEVQWRTANESAIRSYNVERSADGRNFTTIGFVTATSPNDGVASYNWFDAQPLSPLNYYRVKSVGLNGETKQTRIVMLAFNKTSSISIYPNPVQNRLYVTGATIKATYRINAINGQLFQEGVLIEATPVDVHKLPAGKYVLTVNGTRMIFLKQ